MRKYDDDIDPTHAFVETKNRYPRDTLLRKHHFAILSRPRHGPTLWTRCKETFTESDAVSLALYEDEQTA